MSQNIILNRSHIISDDNNKLRYNFPNTVDFEKGDTIAISHFNVFFSWYNISASNNNNKFSYVWFDTDGDLTQTFNVVLPDGFYTVPALYKYIQSVMVTNGHYLVIKETGNFMYFIELRENETYYGLSFRLSSLSTIYDFNDGKGPVSITDKVFAPDSDMWAIPSTFLTPQVIIQNNSNFKDLIGFKAKTIYGDTSTATTNDTYSFLSDITPEMEPSSSFIVTCDIIDNDLGKPNNILYAFTIPNGVEFGDLITSNTDLIYSKIKPGKRNYIDISIYDQDFNALMIRDSNILIVLSILKN
jgi:hypothetical protein